MITFKQMEAMYWVVKLGGFLPAAQKLHATQSAVSKRVQELEALVDTPLFDRSLRTARLTDKGQEMYLMAQRLLDEREQLLQRFLKPEVQKRRIRIGPSLEFVHHLATCRHGHYFRLKTSRMAETVS